MLPWMRQDNDEKHTSGILLSFSQLYKHLHTREFRYEETLSVFDAPTLQTLRSLTLKRSSALMAEARKSGSDLEALDTALLQYASCTESYITKVYSNMANSEKQRVELEWNAPLSQSQLGTYYAINAPVADYILSLALAGECLRRQANCKLAALVQTPANWEEVCPEGPELLHGTAAKLFKRAAGMFAEAAARARAAHEQLPRERPAALQPAMLDALEQASLGEAQAVMADRAERKQSPPTLVAGLYKAAAELFETAAAGLRRGTKDFSHGVSPYVKRYLAVSASLQECRARRCSAAQEQAQLHSGRAMALLRDASKTLSDCVTVAEKESQWVEVLQAELTKAAELSSVCERDRCSINFEPVPAQAPALPEPKLLVASVPFPGLPAPELVFY